MGEVRPYRECTAANTGSCVHDHRPPPEKVVHIVEAGFEDPRFRHVTDFADMTTAHEDGFLVVDADFDVVASIRTRGVSATHIEYHYANPQRYLESKRDGTIAQDIKDGVFGNTSMGVGRFMVLVPPVRDVDLLEVYEAVGARADCTRCGKANLLPDGTWVQHTPTRAKTPCVHTLVPKKQRKTKA